MEKLDASLSLWQTARCWFKAVWVTVLGRDRERLNPALTHVASLPRVQGQTWMPLEPGTEVRYQTTWMDDAVVHGVTVPFDTLSPLFTDTVVEYLPTRPQETRPSDLDQAA